MTECELCTAPTGDSAVVCNGCISGLAADLGEIPDLMDELDIALAKQQAMELGQVGNRLSAPPIPRPDEVPGAAEQPLPISERAFLASVKLHDTLASWTKRPPFTSSKQRTVAMAMSLLAGMDLIRHSDDATSAVVDIGSAVAAVRRVVDLPPARWYAGPCDTCSVDLYAVAGRRTVKCEGCQLVYDVIERRAWLRSAVEDVLATASEIATALTTLDVPVTQASIRGYVHRKVLRDHGVNRKGQKLYRVGDVIDLVIRQKVRSA